MREHDQVERHLRNFPPTVSISNMIENNIVPALGGGLHQAIYTEALLIMLNESKEPGLIINTKNIAKIKFKGRELGFTNIPISISEMGYRIAVIVSANASIVKKDILDAKRILRFSELRFNMVMICNIDWDEQITYEFVTCDTI